MSQSNILFHDAMASACRTHALSVSEAWSVYAASGFGSYESRYTAHRALNKALTTAHRAHMNAKNACLVALAKDEAAHAA